MRTQPHRPTEIFINGRFLTQLLTGVQRVAWEITLCLDELAGLPEFAHVRFTLLAPTSAKDVPALKRIRVKKFGRLQGQLWEQLELPWRTMGRTLLNFGNTGPILKRRQYLTIYDANIFLVPDAFSRNIRLWYTFHLTLAGQYALGIFTTSQFSRRAIARYYRFREAKIAVFHCGKEHILRLPSDSRILEKFSLTPDSYILAVSSMSPNKNFEGIVNAYARLGKTGIKLAIAGGTIPRFFSSVSIQASEGFVHLGYVSDGDLKVLYQNAMFFAYPSFGEGFGIPPLEAVSCGCPVLLANTTCLPEVFGDAGLYCDPHRVEDIADKMRMLVGSALMREELRRKGLELAEKYNWADSARNILETVLHED